MDPPSDNMQDVNATVINRSREGIRGQRSSRPAHPPHRARPATGRAWINGREVGGANPRFAHLAGSYD